MSASNLSANAYSIIKNDILTCRYAPGTTISEDLLAKELGISRTPIRSALVRLEQEQMVRILPKKGIYIPEITLDQIRDIFELRMLIEPYAVRVYGNRFPKEQLLEYVNIFSNSDERDAWDVYQEDSRFHSQLVAQCKNRLLDAQYAAIHNLVIRISVMSGMSSRLVASNREHLAIARAMLTDDYELAEKCVIEHITKAKEEAYSTMIK